MPSTPSSQPFLFWALASKISDAIFALLEVGALSRLAQNPMTAEALSEQLSININALRPLLQLLERAGLIICENGQMILCKDGKQLIPLLELEQEVRRWHRLNDSLLRSLRSNSLNDPLDSIRDKDFFLRYAKAMRITSKAISLHLLKLLKPAPNACFLDLGGADGSIVFELIEQLKESRAVVVDRAAFAEVLEQRRLSSTPGAKVDFVEADLRQPDKLETQISAADIILLINVAHLLSKIDLDQLLILLAKKMQPHARLIVYDQFPSSQGSLTISDLMLVDWVNCGTVFSDTAQQFQSRLVQIGFKHVELRHFPSLPGTFITTQGAHE